MKDLKLSNRKIEFAGQFDKQLQEAPDDIKGTFREVLTFFMADPTHPALRNHALTGKFAGYRSIDVTDDWRAVFREERVRERMVVKFYRLGTHTQLYG